MTQNTPGGKKIGSDDKEASEGRGGTIVNVERGGSVTDHGMPDGELRISTEGRLKALKREKRRKPESG